MLEVPCIYIYIYAYGIPIGIELLIIDSAITMMHLPVYTGIGFHGIPQRNKQKSRLACIFVVMGYL